MRVCAHCHRTLGDAERSCSRDGAEGRDVEPLVFPPALAERFSGVEPFAQSPHSACYLATQPKTGFRGLLKVIPLAGVDASERGRLKRELRKQVKLAHPGLPRLIDGGELPADLWLLRDHVDGESLAQRLRRDARLELDLALAITAQVASALDELHRAGILHRDVRPGRIVLQARSEGPPLVKLLDAGIAARQRTTGVFDLLGTPAYMSPEHIGGKLLSFRSDLYALGCVLYEMLAGRPPFVSDDVRALLEAHERARPPALDRELPAPVASLLASLLDKEPRKRPFSAQQVRRALDPFLPANMPAAAAPRPASGPVVPPEVSRKQPPAPPGGVARPESSPETTQELELTDDLANALEQAAQAQPIVSMPPDIAVELAAEEPAPATPEPPVAEPAKVAPEPRASSPVRPVPSTPTPAPAPAAEPPRSSRASVAFDVESLFDAPQARAKAEVDETAATSLYEQPDEALRRRVHEAQADEARASADRTVVVRMPASKRRWPLFAGGAGALLVALVAVSRCGESSPEQLATDASHGAQVSPATPPAAAEDERANRVPAEATKSIDKEAPSLVAAAPIEPAQPAVQPEAQAEAQPVASPTPAMPAVQDPATAAQAAAPRRATPASQAPRPARPERPSAADHKAEGRAHYQAGRYRDAARAYERATRESPKDGGAFAGLGASHLALNEPQPAIRAYQRAVQIDGSSSGFHAALGRAYAQAGDRNRARAAYEKALSLNPKNGAAKAALERLR